MATRTSNTRRPLARVPLAAWGVVIVVAIAAALMGGIATGAEHDQVIGDHGVDGPDGFGADILAPHTTFPDDVAAQLRFRYAEPGADRRTHVSNLPDAGTVVLAEVHWEPAGTSGWHTHPGPVIVTVVDGEVQVTNADDCLSRTYTAGQAFIDPGEGNVHIATNASGATPARAYAMFLAVPAGEPATEHVEPADC